MEEPIFCKPRIHCKRCKESETWRDDLANTHGPFVCPDGVSSGSKKEKGWVETEVDRYKIAEKHPVKIEKNCVYMKKQEEPLKQGCGCKRKKVICTNKELIDALGGQEVFNRSVEATNTFPPSQTVDKCVSDKCRFYKGE